MNKFVGLLLVVGLGAAAYLNRDKIAALRGGGTVPMEDAEVAPTTAPVPNATPNPAHESQALATRLYPGLSVPNSPLNKKFVKLYAEAKSTDPGLLAGPDWPIKLAERAVISMGGAPMPIPKTETTRAAPLEGSVLDRKPTPKK